MDGMRSNGHRLQQGKFYLAMTGEKKRYLMRVMRAGTGFPEYSTPNWTQP